MPAGYLVLTRELQGLDEEGCHVSPLPVGRTILLWPRRSREDESKGMDALLSVDDPLVPMRQEDELCNRNADEHDDERNVLRRHAGGKHVTDNRSQADEQGPLDRGPSSSGGLHAETRSFSL